MKILIIDGFIDEPTCLGVPPFLSTYVRYTAGAAVCAGIKDTDYITIEYLRKNDFILRDVDVAVIIAGNPVPGKYLGGMPIKGFELEMIASRNPETAFFAGGPIQFDGIDTFLPRNLNIIHKDIESFIYHYLLEGKNNESFRTIDEINLFSIAGAYIAQKHPRYPEIIAEIETGRGCPRLEHCSFCIEAGYKVEFRNPVDIIREVKALYSAGIRHFRIGKQADLYSYGSQLQEWKNGFPKPNIDWIRKLYTGIRDGVPGLKTLHLDNVNPGTLAAFPDESAEITGIIVNNNTAGDVAALGMESADPGVIEKNFLKALPSGIIKAVEIINNTGNIRENGIPKLLPGINLIRGLIGESRETFRMNYEFLKQILDKGLLLRRINIRQIKLSGNNCGDKRFKTSPREEKKLDAVFRNYREKIRDEIDNPMIQKIFPVGTIMKDLIVEAIRGDWSIARAIGSYAIAVNIPKILPVLSGIDVFVVGWRNRSLIGLPNPLIIKNSSLQELKQIPGFSKKAGEIFASGNFNKSVFSTSPAFEKIKDYLI